MSDSKHTQDPTADYRQYKKGPNFLLIVILSSVMILVILALAVFVVGSHGKQLAPHPPNPTPNSLAQPLFPASAGPVRA